MCCHVLLVWSRRLVLFQCRVVFFGARGVLGVFCVVVVCGWMQCVAVVLSWVEGGVGVDGWYFDVAWLGRFVSGWFKSVGVGQLVLG